MTKLIPARPTLYKGIQMRSRLEADYARVLDRCDLSWKYEPTCFAGPSGQWLPDFRVHWLNSNEYVELKPESFLYEEGEGWREKTDRVNELLRRMEMAWLTEPEAYLHVVIWKYGADKDLPDGWYYRSAERGAIWSDPQHHTGWLCAGVPFATAWPRQDGWRLEHGQGIRDH